MSGSGDADTAGLTTRDARVASSGSGDVEVRASERLDVTSTARATCATTATRR